MDKLFWDVVKSRHSNYALSDKHILAPEQIEEIVENALLYTPSAFNSQSARMVILFGAQSKKFWQITLDAIRAITNDEQYAASEAKITSSFASGYGTILFFEDQGVVSELQNQFPGYKDNFPVWSLQSAGMHQFVVWSALTAAGLGASLQHYNPIVDEKVRQEWNIDPSWKLWAQMPFGAPLMVPEAKEHKDIKNRLKIFS